MNHCIFAGFVLLDPSRKFYAKDNSGNYYCKILLRVLTKKDTGEYRSDYIKLFGWNSMADTISERVTKGSKICVRCIARELVTVFAGKRSSHIIFVIRELDVISYADQKEFFEDYEDTVFGDDLDEAIENYVPGQCRIDQIMSAKANSSLNAFEEVDRLIDSLQKNKAGESGK